jgi:hypothetical protein
MREIFACSVSSCAKAPWKANKKTKLIKQNFLNISIFLQQIPLMGWSQAQDLSWSLCEHTEHAQASNPGPHATSKTVSLALSFDILIRRFVDSSLE